MRRGMLLTGSALLALSCAGVGAGELTGSVAPALEAHRDPATGRFVEPAPEVAAKAAAADGFALGASSSAGLVERPVDSPAGGFAVDLGGRFRSSLVARRGEGGKLEVTCEPEAPQEAGRRDRAPNPAPDVPEVRR